MKRILWTVLMMAGLFMYSCGGGEAQKQEPAPPATEHTMQADTSAMDSTMMDSTDVEAPEDDGDEAH